ncbi:dihydrofolate:folylpolyglutamate synthetase FolC [Legionella busanensis]|uniref:Dihydrofolate synthase/folylpolyglutamate synthase n=1 Tax=Legionella busanensis TaxID=190655 RepID=A0A378JKE8_9GAMM|nr:bifunctional tetrahydrofolate synthase/dihydrofolate synthase [Legionella busanensis]STX51644.1 dihydrofolate:folylpolyglutamate synthetase FolC [Legionella busanensis]
MIKEKNLSQWLDDLERRHVQTIQLGLERITEVATTLDVLNFNAVIITVGGTNGKGSTVASLEAIYKQAGYKVATYTSPHLINFNERICVNQKPITDLELIEAFNIIDKARGSIALTYFEIATLAALWHFKQQCLDLIILEVGLGGRLDAVNCIDADLAIITTVDYDHEDYLGNTLEKIGYEKAGIIRPNKPVIYADENPPKSILNKAASCEAPVYRKNQEFSYELVDDKIKFSYQNINLTIPQMSFHPNSIAAALMATFCLKKYLPIKADSYVDGIKKIKLAGRCQIITKLKRTLLDVAHNPQAVQYLAHYLKTHYPNVKVHAVFSAFADKDIIGMIKPLKDVVHFWYPTLLPGKRAASANQLISSLAANDINLNICYNSPFLAYQAACKEAEGHDLIVVFGSFIIVGAILSASLNESNYFKNSFSTLRNGYEINN